MRHADCDGLTRTSCKTFDICKARKPGINKNLAHSGELFGNIFYLQWRDRKKIPTRRIRDRLCQIRATALETVISTGLNLRPRRNRQAQYHMVCLHWMPDQIPWGPLGSEKYMTSAGMRSRGVDPQLCGRLLRRAISAQRYAHLLIHTISSRWR
jgi:hypothetical protein